jgi:ribonuclease G
MSKEMFISSSPHETKLAVLEDDQLVEVFYERDTDVGLVGGIYKGRVSRVLPGMQSAFVDIGLERDAFLYVSDFFFENQDDYDKVFEEAESRAVRLTTEQAQAAAGANSLAVAPNNEVSAPVAPIEIAPQTADDTTPAPGQFGGLDAPEAVASPAAEATSAAPNNATPSSEVREPEHFEPRGRRRRHRGRKFGDPRHTEHRFFPKEEQPASQSFEILPGESLAKYNHAVPETREFEPGDFAGLEAVKDESLEAGEDGVTDRKFETRGAEASGPAFTGAAAVGLEEPPSSTIKDEPQFTPAAFVRSLDANPTAECAGGHVPEILPASQAQTPADAPAEVELSAAEAMPTLPETELPAAGSSTIKEEEPIFVDESAEDLSTGPAETSGTVPEPAPVQAGAAGTASEPGERTYTLREPHQRPRFAPRRGRRGRRGMGNHGRGETGRESRPGNNSQPVQIAELLKEGQEILVQISKEPLGTKGARITSHVALPGRYLVYMPTIDHIGVSRKISSEEERLRLRNIILEHKGSLTGGFIVRTAGAGRPEEEFKADLKFLSTLWSEIRSKSERAKSPALIHRDLDLVQRVLRDTLTPDFKSVRVDSEIEYERILDHVNRTQPSLIDKVKLHTRNTPLFDEFGIHAEIEKALKPKVWLKSGGYIVINQTEALVAIDVNTGKYVGKTNRLEDTILKTNIDAVKEIVRQIRLRDLGGIIVIDFIDMDERKNRAKVTEALEEALRGDRAPTKVIAFHDFGLVAITRKRVKQSLERTLCERCSYCSGSGWIKSASTICYEILDEARKMADQIEGDAMTLRVNPEVAKTLKSREGVFVSELESITHKDIIIKSDPAVHQERFEIF